MSGIPGYQDSLRALVETKPLIAKSLQMAEERRAQRLADYMNGMRLKGIEQLYAYLDTAVVSFTASPEFADQVFLVCRARADFETALEATLSGYQGVAADAMRDVMEIEGLLLDFATHPGNAVEWRNAERKARMKKFGPAAVRERLKAAGLPPYSNEHFEPIDYRAHSEALHVTPPGTRLNDRGPEAPNYPSLFADLGFVEIFEHGNRILSAIEMTRILGLGVPDDYKPLMPMDDFGAAYERTQEMQVIMVAMVEGPQLLKKKLNRVPTASEVLEYVAGDIQSKSPRASSEDCG
ncbi:hypothetical protein ACFWAY_17975 [Rhodococcus sp. NPDC059968]|uniref:hypothetical protein n=1 Tax=Rhodococcus sp. NPDC059968 TaxID=3347017 RepID=UPI00366E8879